MLAVDFRITQNLIRPTTWAVNNFISLHGVMSDLINNHLRFHDVNIYWLNEDADNLDFEITCGNHALVFRQEKKFTYETKEEVKRLLLTSMDKFINWLNSIPHAYEICYDFD